MESEVSVPRSSGGKSREAFRTISEVAEHLDLPQHVLRFWESKFTQINPLKRGGNRRYYRPEDVALITAIKKLLHTEGYTIRGVQKLFKAQGVKATISQATGDAPIQHQEPETAMPMPEGLVAKASHGDAPSVQASAMIDKEKVQSVLLRLKAIRAQLG